MSSHRNQSSTKFDLEKAIETALHYSKSTGANCRIIDMEGSILFETNTTNACKVCKTVQEIYADNSFCKNSRLYGAHQSKRFGGKYIFLCPIGLINWASPITVDGIMVGAFLCGSYVMVEPDTKLIEGALRKLNINMNEIDLLINYLNTAPSIKPDKVTSLSELLFVISCYISDIEHLKYLEEQNNQNNLSSIAEYIQHLKNLEDDKEKEVLYPLEKEKDLLNAIKQGDRLEAQKNLNEIIGHIFFKAGANLKLIKTRILELLVMLSRIVLDSSIDHDLILQLNHKYIWEINRIKSIDELTSYVNKIFTQFFEYLFSYNDIKHVDAIYKSIDYIRNNYMKKITLEEVAKYVHLSPTYFSKIFKAEMKTNFKDYLNKIRIDKSKSLLLDKSISITDISQLVGFTDQSYYSKVFKKVSGVTPGKYRKCQGKIILVSELKK
ncbi:PocR ligand-binding domain-containing protein [Wukongibacter baidiensis]|uniref:PocR ligand-binding domain-containing protein n=1 Tax=Wukongibacter baidiensis TaxID=1723361 RepID=UPI003D7F208B